MSDQAIATTVETLPANPTPDVITETLAEAAKPAPKKRPTAAESLAKQKAADKAAKLADLNKAGAENAEKHKTTPKPVKEKASKAKGKEKKPAKKVKPAPAKTESGDPKKKKYRKIEREIKGGLKVGSTRLRMFKAIAQADETLGITAGEIKALTGMLPNSGHLGVLLTEEIKRGRVKVRTGWRGENEREINVYTLSGLGKKDLDEGRIDGNTHAGNRIGAAWTGKRKKAEKLKGAEASK